MKARGRGGDFLLNSEDIFREFLVGEFQAGMARDLDGFEDVGGKR